MTGMIGGNLGRSIFTRLREAVRGAAARFPGAPGADVAPPTLTPPNRSYAAPDPTIGLFGEADDGDEAGHLPLSTQLEESARAMVRRTEALREDANRLVARIGERAEGEITLAAQAARVLIGLVWFGVAAWLYNSGLTAKADDLAALANGMPVDDAFVLSRTFAIIAAAAFAVAVGIASLVAGFGKAGNENIRREAEQLGLKIADASQDFDRALTGFRGRMDRHSNPANAIGDLSRAHLTALEACVFFREIAFLTGAEGAEASRLFKGFLRRPATPPPALPTLILGVMLGGLVGAAFVYANYVPKPEVVTPAVPLALAQYPWAINLLFFGGLAYAGAGIVVSMIGGVFAHGAISKAREEALDALRSAFTAREAPRPADVVRRIEDAVDVFRARLGGRGGGPIQGGTNHGAGDNGDFSGEADNIPPWRRRDSSVKFVDTGFQVAPQTWRTDAYEKKLSPEPEAKRGVFGLKKPPGD